MTQNPRVSVAICLHHKPWLAMGSLVSLFLQDYKDFDLFLLFNEGDGSCPEKPGYAAYAEHLKVASESEIIRQSPALESIDYQAYDSLARASGVNPKLSPFDKRLYDICKIKFKNVQVLKFDNDQALDSGVWLKFIRSKAWRDYDYVFTFQEGTLLTSPLSLSSALSFARSHEVEFLASAHMKGRMPKSRYFSPCLAHVLPDATDLDHLHDRMAQLTLETLSRDPALKAALGEWNEDLPSVRQFHVRDYEWTKRLRLLSAILPDRPLVGNVHARRLKKLLKLIFSSCDRFAIEHWLAQLAVFAENFFPNECRQRRHVAREHIFVDASRVPLNEVVEHIAIDGVLYHPANGPGWHAAGCNHMFSGKLLEEMEGRLSRYALYDVLDIPFAGTSLELFWTYIPAWLGRSLWFWDGFHRVTKDPWTSAREDDAKGIALHLNRYYFGQIAVQPKDDLISVSRLGRQSAFLRNILPALFFTS